MADPESKLKLEDLRQQFHDLWLLGTGWRLEAGELCYQIRSLCEHGDWGAFLDEYDIPRSTADDWIRRYKEHAEITESRQPEEPNPAPAPDPESDERTADIVHEKSKRKGRPRTHSQTEVRPTIKELKPDQTARYWAEYERDRKRVNDLWLLAFRSIIREEVNEAPDAVTSENVAEEEPLYRLLITPQACRTDAEVEVMRGQFANPAHYNYLIEEDAIVVGPDGVIARLVTNCLEPKLVANTREHFAKVKGDLSGRGSIVGKGAMMARQRKDGTLSHTTGVPLSIVKKMRAQNTYSDFLGWMDASKHGDRFPQCRQTAWSRNSPEIHGAAEPFIRAVDTVYAQELPDHYSRQMEFMKPVSAEFKFVGTTFSTCTVNRNLRTAYHTDHADFAGGMGNLVVLAGEDGALVMPKFRIAFLPRPTDVLLMNVHEMHGNLPFTGERLTAVLYARERIDECGRE
jgi:hypothetical protein